MTTYAAVMADIRKAREVIVDRFWSRVNREGEGCWLWTKCADSNGYGIFDASKLGLKRREKSHRVAFFLKEGSLPPAGHVVMHSCDVPACCNPSHLVSGTHAENVRDSVQKGRWAIARRGERGSRAILTDEAALAIKAAFMKGAKVATLATAHGVKYHAVWNLCHGRSWRHI